MGSKPKKYNKLSEQEKEYILGNHKGVGLQRMIGILYQKFGNLHYKRQLQEFYKKNNISSGLASGAPLTTSSELSQEEKEYILNNYKGVSASKMADTLLKKFNKTHTKNQINKFYKANNLESGIVARSPYLALNELEKAYIIENHKGVAVETMVKKLFDKFGVEHSAGQVRQVYYKNGLSSGVDGRYVKGQTSRNKGLKMNDFMSEDSISKLRANQKIAVTGKNNVKYKPIGSTYISSRGEVIEKVAEPNTWQRQHIVVWEKAYGKLSPGQNIIHIDGDSTNNKLENLRLANDSELRYYNMNNPTDNSEINDAIYNVSKLSSAINTKIKNKKERKE